MKDILIKLVDHETSRKAHVTFKSNNDQKNKVFVTKKRNQDKKRDKSNDRDMNKKKCFNYSSLNHQKNDC